jgi:lipooligosaccharide transport system permease protein
MTAALDPALPGLRPGPRARIASGPRASLHVLEHHLLVYRRTFRGTLFTTFLSPVLFLAAMGLGLGGLVDRSQTSGLEGVPYLVFLAPGLLAGQAMQTAAGESMYPIMAGLVWLKTYHAMVASPIEIVHIVIGQMLWFTVRLLLSCAVFVAVMVVFGATDIWHGIALVPLAVLTGLAFAAPITAYSATQRRDSKFAAINRFLITPLFIFSGVFFPLTQLPWFIQPIGWLTPLWHGIELLRAVQLNRLEPVGLAIHLAVLIGWIAVGMFFAVRTFRKALIK